MPKTGKKYLAAKKQVEERPYTLQDAVPLVQKIKFAKFDETVEVHMRLGRRSEARGPEVRGTIVLPNGLGKSKKVLVIASGDKLREAEAAGADYRGRRRDRSAHPERKLDGLRRRDRDARHDALGG